MEMKIRMRIRLSSFSAEDNEIMQMKIRMRIRLRIMMRIRCPSFLLRIMR